MWSNVVLGQNLDGLYITVGPVGGASRVEGNWYSAFGAELSVVQVVEKRVPAAVGVALGGVAYAGRDGGRLWLEAETAIAAPLPFPVGLGAGLALEIDSMRGARFGGQTTLWFLAGVVPYVRLGAVRESGRFVEAGLMLKIPARRFP